MKNNKCTIVMYHYVRDMHKTTFPDIKGRLIKDFKGQLNYILQNYKVISLRDYLELLEGKQQIPEKACILTFDDGFKDHYKNVFPILKELNLTASFFPCTEPLVNIKVLPVHKVHFLLAKLGGKKLVEEYHKILKQQFPEEFENYKVEDKGKKDEKYVWDDSFVANLKHALGIMDYKLKVKILDILFSKYIGLEKEFCKELYMSWDEITEISEAGFDIGCHTITHPRLTSITEEGLDKELLEPKKLIESKIKKKIISFCPPYGDFNENTIEKLKKIGYRCSLTTDNGVNEGKSVDQFRLKRLDTNNIPVR